MGAVFSEIGERAVGVWLGQLHGLQRGCNRGRVGIPRQYRREIFLHRQRKIQIFPLLRTYSTLEMGLLKDCFSLTINLAIKLFGIFPKELKIDVHANSCTWMF